MSATTTPSSALARYRPFILSLTGFAAAYGLYLVITTSQHSPPAPLHRSNAVHRPRRRRSLDQRIDDAQMHTEENATPGTPVGLEIRPDYGQFSFPGPDGNTMIMDLRPYAIPDLDAFQATTGFSEVAAREELDRVQRLFLDRFVGIHFSHAHTSRPRRDSPEMVWLETWMAARGITRQNWELTMDGFFDDDAEADRVTVDGTDVDEQQNHVGGGEQDQEGQNLKQLLYYVAEEQSRQEGYIHRGVTCNSCDIKPIRGVRWRCSNCADYDLCSECHSVGMHPRTHIFYEVKVPAPFIGNPRQAQPVPYPGKPQLMPRFLPAELCKRYITETSFEKAEVEGLYEQFTCLAAYHWENDPSRIGAAIDRQSFEKAFVPLTSIIPPRPNLIYDRMFAFYDSNGDGLIGFEEFLQGLACIHNKSKDPNFSKLRKVFEGYDVDNDGFVSRKDFLRIFRAFYAIQKDITRDWLAVQEEELTINGALDTIASSQPLSAAFTEVSIPRGERGTPPGKKPDEFGDTRSTPRQTPDRPEDTIDKETIIGHSWESLARLPFDEDGSEPLSNGRIRATTTRLDGSTEHREVQLMHSGRNIPDARDEAVRERWRRRQFYTDEEEGFLPDSLPLIANGSLDHSESLPSPALRRSQSEDGHVSPRSRSSSKVRFQDDVEFETRSNASTSSRPYNERFGSYEIPEAEKDFGKEILWQVVEDGMNELLDPLFKHKEDLAMAAFATRTERRRWRDEIANFHKEKEEQENRKRAEEQDPLMAMATALQGQQKVVEALSDEVADVIANGTVELDSAIEDIERTLARTGLDDMLQENGYAIAEEDAASRERIRRDAAELEGGLGDSVDGEVTQFSLETEVPGLGFEQTFESLTVVDPSPHVRGDPTLPQFRPNSAENTERVLLLDPTQPGFLHQPDDEFPIYEPPTDADPTMPQNRPNSEVEETKSTTPLPSVQRPIALTPAQQQEDAQKAYYGATLLSWHSNTSKPIPEPEDDPSFPQSQPLLEPQSNGHLQPQLPTEERLAHLARLDEVERVDRARGGPGRLNYEEFVGFMNGPKGRAYGFVEEWLRLGSF